MSLVGVLDAQSCFKMHEQVGTGHEPTHQRQLRLPVKGFEEHFEGLIPIVDPEIVEAGIGLRPGYEGILIQRNDALQIEAAAFFIDAPYPLRPHGGSPLLGPIGHVIVHRQLICAYCAAARQCQKPSGNRRHLIQLLQDLRVDFRRTVSTWAASLRSHRSGRRNGKNPARPGFAAERGVWRGSRHISCAG